jgi:hypothetical protein
MGIWLEREKISTVEESLRLRYLKTGTLVDPSLLSHIRSIRENRKIYLKILTDLHILNSPKYENWIWNGICIRGWMCALLAPEQMNGFCSYSALKSSSVIHNCLVNVNSVAPKRGALQTDTPPPQKITVFLRTAQTILIAFQ